jgi:ParB-like chromosome segregation protein Spo0J
MVSYYNVPINNHLTRISFCFVCHLVSPCYMSWLHTDAVFFHLRPRPGRLDSSRRGALVLLVCLRRPSRGVRVSRGARWRVSRGARWRAGRHSSQSQSLQLWSLRPRWTFLNQLKIRPTGQPLLLANKSAAACPKKCRWRSCCLTRSELEVKHNKYL